MTKNAADENTLKCHMNVEETNKIGEVNNMLAVCDAQVRSGLEEKVDIIPIISEVEPERDKLGKVMRELYNLEDSNKPAKSVKIDLDMDLYQMEKV